MDSATLSIIIWGFIGGIVVLINPFLGLLAISALIPLSLLPPIANTFLGLFTMATPIKIMGAWTFVSSFVRHISTGKSWGFLKRPQIKFFLIFLLWIFISGLTQPCSFTRENFTAFTSYAVLGFIILSLVTNIKRVRWVIWLGLLCMFIVSLQAIFNYSSFQEAARMRGESYGPNYFAIGLLPFLGIAFYNIFVEKKKLLKTFSLIIAITIVTALIVTISRGGLIGLAGMFVIAAVAAKKKLKTFLFLAICATILINVMPAQVWERFERTKLEGPIGEETVASTQRRFLLAKAGWQMFLAHPIFGVGVGNYYWECRNYQAISAGRAHNMYLEIMAELGIIGTFFFLGILFSTFKSLKKIINDRSPTSGYARGFYIGLAGFLIAAIFLHAQHEKVLWFVIFMAVALEQIAFKKESLGDKKS